MNAKYGKKLESGNLAYEAEEQGLSCEATCSIPFNKWMQQLDEHCKKLGYGTYGSDCGADSWEDFYHNGYTPEDAMTEEMSYWD